jgi:hypothetical protein
LHLLGFDDEEESDRLRMIAEMNRAAVAAGLKPDENWSSLLHAAEGLEDCGIEGLGEDESSSIQSSNPPILQSSKVGLAS